jgi:hypothetical protein
MIILEPSSPDYKR